MESARDRMVVQRRMNFMVVCESVIICALTIEGKILTITGRGTG